jgi:hypothetical protein
MARFKYTENSQGQFIVVNLKEPIAFGTFEWAVSHIIDKTDMSLFEKGYDTGENLGNIQHFNGKSGHCLMFTSLSGNVKELQPLSTGLSYLV